MEQGITLLAFSAFCLIFGSVMRNIYGKEELTQVISFIFASISLVFGIMCLTGFVS